MSFSPRKNLLFIITDHQRSDSIGMVQNGREVTPHLNRLAKESNHFTRAYTTSPLCVPARAALATGLYPAKNGVLTNNRACRAAPSISTLHEVLCGEGYELAHVGVDHLVVEPEMKKRLPWSLWVGESEHQEYLAGMKIEPSVLGMSSFRKAVRENCEGVREEKAYSSTKTAVWPWEAEHFKDCYWCDQAIDFLKHDRDKPFALFLNLWAPHPPLLVPQPYASVFQAEKLNLPGNVGQSVEEEPEGLREGIAAQLADGVSMEEWRQTWAAHLGLVHLADQKIGEVLQALDSKGLFEETVIVFTSDHGDHLGQHRLYQKMELYEPAIKVPLIIRNPASEPEVHHHVVSHLDLFPTIAELLDVCPPTNLDGESLVSNKAGSRSFGDRKSEYAFFQYSGNPGLGDIRRGVVSRRYKYIWHGSGSEELFDLEQDPEEMNNLASVCDLDLLERFRSITADWASSHMDTIYAKGIKE